MKKFKALALVVSGVLFLALFSLLAWILILHSEIQEKLASKKYLPPTEYYSAPKYFWKGQKLATETLQKDFKIRTYQEVPWGSRITEGLYSWAAVQDCQNNFPGTLPENTARCLFFHAKETPDPELKNFGLQMLAVDSEQKVLEVYQGNPLATVAVAALEPFRFAQYLESDPIEQNYTPLGQIPTQCLNAVLAIEDSKFLEHSGVSFTGILRALVVNVIFRRAAQGGSTITQQMVKNYFLTPERTLRRKAKEILMSLILENSIGKDEIFDTYLNIIYLGQNGPFQIRGFPAASEFYFSKPIEQLGLKECSLLAAILNSPGLFDPFRKPDNAKKRRGLVLDRMQQLGFISATDYQQTLNQDLGVTAKPSIFETAPYYVDAVRRELKAANIDISGTKIFTGMDPVAQEFAQKSVQSQLSRLEKDHATVKKIKESGKNLEGVLLSAENKTGLVTAIVGGRSFKLTQFNRAIDGHRQIGSIMKPFVFLTALMKSTRDSAFHSPMSKVMDEKTPFKYSNRVWTPENYGKKYFGEVPLYFALKNSLNSATVKVGLEAGLSDVIETAQKAGITSKLDPVPSMLLGAFELYPFEVLQSYLTLANLGEQTKLRTLRYVLGTDGQTLLSKEKVSEQSLPPDGVAILVAMMKQTILGGTGQMVSKSGFAEPAAGKTGTTSDNRDAWFAGFTPDLTTVSWVGYDDNTPHNLTGASGAIPIWLDFMKAQIGNQALHEDFPWPEGLKKERITNPFDTPHDIDLLFYPD